MFCISLPWFVWVLLYRKNLFFCDKIAVICDVTAFLTFFGGWIALLGSLSALREVFLLF